MKLLHHGHGLVAFQFRRLLGQPREPFQNLEVAPDARLDARMLHLHHHLAAIGQARAMDLSNRGGADGYRIELSEDLIRRPAQFGGYRGESDFRLIRRHAVLQLGQLIRDFLPDEIGPGAEHLAELDVGRA